MVSWLVDELGDRAGTLLGGRGQSLPLGPLEHDPLLVADRVQHLGLDSLVQRPADALGNVGRGANERSGPVRRLFSAASG